MVTGHAFVADGAAAVDPASIVFHPLADT